MVNNFERFGEIKIKSWATIIRRNGSQVLRITASRIMDKVLFGCSDRYICPISIDDWWSTNAKQKLYQIIYFKNTFIRVVDNARELLDQLKREYLLFYYITDLHYVIFVDWLLCFRRGEKQFPSRPWFICKKPWNKSCLINVYD